jgi:hypothetical protein
MRTRITDHNQPADTRPVTDREVIDDAYRRLVRVHYMLAESLSTDQERIAKATDELTSVLSDLGAYRKAHPVTGGDG